MIVTSIEKERGKRLKGESTARERVEEEREGGKKGEEAQMLALRKNRSARLVGRITRSSSRNQKRSSREIFRGKGCCLGSAVEERDILKDRKISANTVANRG